MANFLFYRYKFVQGSSDASLLSDAEVSEDVAEDFVCGDFADDGAEVVDGFADVLGDEVGRDGEGEAFLGAEEGGACVGECLDVTLVCDKGCVAVGEEVTLRGGEDFAKG